MAVTRMAVVSREGPLPTFLVPVSGVVCDIQIVLLAHNELSCEGACGLIRVYKRFVFHPKRKKKMLLQVYLCCA